MLRVPGSEIVIHAGPLYTYRLQLTAVPNGFTVQGWVDLGFGLRSWQALQLLGIRCALPAGETRAEGQAAVQHLLELMGDAGRSGQLLIRTSRDAAGRLETGSAYLATVFARGRNLNVQMVADGYAYPYWPRPTRVEDKVPG